MKSTVTQSARTLGQEPGHPWPSSPPPAMPPSLASARIEAPTSPAALDASPLLENALWEELADEIADNERKRGDQRPLWDSLPSPPLRLYEVVSVMRGRGIVVEETTCLPPYRFEIRSSRAARVFRVGDTFGLGQNQETISIWAPDRAYRS